MCIGFSQANTPGSLVFVTGLAGHAFGSWKTPGKHTMWVRDFLARDLDHDTPGKFRILTYGYDSTLSANNSNAGICEFSRGFLESIKNVRRLRGVRISVDLGSPLVKVTRANIYATIRETGDLSCLWLTAWGVL